MYYALYREKHLIEELREEKKQYSVQLFLNEFPNKNKNRSGLDHLIEKIGSFGSIKWRPGINLANCNVRNHDNVDEVADLVQSQENAHKLTRPPDRLRAWPAYPARQSIV